METTTPMMTGGCQCGAVRYALFETPESTICHCRMCQKAVGGPFAALCKVKRACFGWTSGKPASFRSSSVAERHFCQGCGTPLTFCYLDGDGIEVTTGSLDDPAGVPPTLCFGIESRLSWIDLVASGRLRAVAASDSGSAKRTIVSYQHPDRDAADA